MEDVGINVGKSISMQNSHAYSVGQSPRGTSGNDTTSEDSNDYQPQHFSSSNNKDLVSKLQKPSKGQKKKKKKDPNAPQKPISAYSSFFRDTQAAIKGQNPNATFGEVSKIVASMWDALEAQHKNVYIMRQEAARKEYLKAMAAYRASNPKSATLSEEEGSENLEQDYSCKTEQIISSDGDFQKSPVQTNNLPASNNREECHSGFKPSTEANDAPSTVHVPTTKDKMFNSNSAMPPVCNMCIRHGCTNVAVRNSEWEDEYCSNECVISHCKDVFASWVSSNLSCQQVLSGSKINGGT